MTAADAVVAPEWLSANLAAIDEGADLVAGFVGRHRSPPAGSSRLAGAFGGKVRHADACRSLRDLIDGSAVHGW